MNDDSVNLFDKLLDSVRRDQSKLEEVLAKHPDMREELEPFLKTAMFLGGSVPPTITAEARQSFRSKVLGAGMAAMGAASTAVAAVRHAPRAERGVQPNGGGHYLLNPHMQAFVNVVVILILLTTLILAGVMVMPVKTPVGKVVGEMANHRYLI